MAVIATGAHPKALWPGVKAWWGAKYNEHPVEYTQIFDTHNSTQNYEEDVKHHGFGLAPVKPEGSATKYDDHTQLYVSRYVHVAYSLGYVCTKEELADNLYEKVSMQRAASLAFSMRQTEENVGANVLNRAFNSSYTGGDGKELLATDHPSPAGNFSNELSTPADLSEAALEDLSIQMMNAVDARGLKISLVPKRLIIPTALTFEADRILKSSLRVDTANNDVNALKMQGMIPEVAVNHYLTDSDAFFIKSNVENGMKWYNRADAEFTKDEDFDTENAKSKCYRRFSAGWSDPLGMWGSPGA